MGGRNCKHHFIGKAHLFLIYFTFQFFLGFSQEYSWSASAGSVGEDYGLDQAKDNQGNIYSTGYFSGILDINTNSTTTIISSSGSKDVFITKHNSNGNFIWGKRIGSLNADVGNSIAVDDSNFIYILGTYQGTVDFDPSFSTFNLTSNGIGTFLLKLDQNGVFNWVIDLNVIDPYSITINQFGEIIFLSSSYTGKVSNSGIILWKKPIVTPIGTSNSVTNDKNGGSYFVDASLGGQITKIDTSGNVVWVKSIPVYSKAIEYDQQGYVYITGYFGGTVDFDPGAGIQNLTSLGNKDIFVLKLDSSGGFIWAKNFGSSANFYDEGNSLCLSPNGELFITGTYGGGNNDFDPGPGNVSLPSGGGTEIFILKLDTNGNFVWVTSSAGGADDESRSIIYSNNALFLTGYFTSSVLFFDLVNFSDQLSNNGGNGDVFFAKLKDCLNTFSTINVTECGNYFSPSGNYVFNTSGVYSDTLINSTGCDSIITINLTIQPVFSILNPQTICVGTTYEINNNSYSSPGTYIDTLTTILGCDSIVITQLNLQQLISINTTKTEPNCGMANGSIAAIVNSGSLAYSAIWSNGDIGNLADSLVAGQYILQVTATNGCINSVLVSLNSIGGPVVNQASITNVECYGEASGSISLNITSFSPHTSFWSNGLNGDNISNLLAGIYDLVVTDSLGCSSFFSYSITEPNPLSLNFSATTSSCGNADGSAMAIAFGGTGNYTYQWSPTAGSQFSPLASNLFSGIYSCTVTDNNGCQTTGSVAISTSTPGPILSSTVNPAIGCGISQGGQIDLQVSGGLTPYNFQWSNGQYTEDLSGLSNGTYTVIVSGANGCSSSLSVDVSNSISAPSSVICLVSVDTTTNTNKIYWEKPALANGISYYTLFRESSNLGIYVPIKNIPFDSLSEWTDPFANPQIRGWRYKVSITDSCGIQSTKSPEHKTIHLTANNGVGGVVNLSWDAYIGFSYNLFYIWRFNGGLGWELLDSVPANLFSYTDLSPPSNGNLSYYIEVVSPQNCQSSYRASQGINNENLTNIVKTRSNVKNNRIVGITEFEQSENDFKIFPNPNEGEFWIHSSNSDLNNYSIYNSISQEIQSGSFYKNKKISVENNDYGIYYIRIKSREKVTYKKIYIGQ